MRLQTCIFMLLILFGAVGCSGLLPVAKSTDESRWESFDQAKSCFERIIPEETTKKELLGFGFDPYKDGNIQIHNYLALINRFMPNTNITLEDLPPPASRNASMQRIPALPMN